VAEWTTWLTGNPVTLSSGSVKDACGVRYCNGAKAKRILGYEPRVGIEEGIRISCQVGSSASAASNMNPYVSAGICQTIRAAAARTKGCSEDVAVSHGVSNDRVVVY
jgi:hypothetical protein